MSDHVGTEKKERKIKTEDLIVSKTDLEGNITYCNAKFMIYSGHNLEDLIGKKHTSTSHPDMPQSIFRHMREELERFNEVCSVIKNQSKDGAYYWTFINATPSFDVDNKHIGYFLVQRSVSAEATAYFSELYREMCKFEPQSGQASDIDDQAMNDSYQVLNDVAAPLGGHNEFFFSYYA